MSFEICVQRGFKDIQQEVKNYYLSKNAFTIVKRNKEKGGIENGRIMYQKGVANGSKEGKYILSKRAHYRKSVKRSDVIARGNIFVSYAKK